MEVELAETEQGDTAVELREAAAEVLAAPHEAAGGAWPASWWLPGWAPPSPIEDVEKACVELPCGRRLRELQRVA